MGHNLKKTAILWEPSVAFVREQSVWGKEIGPSVPAVDDASAGIERFYAGLRRIDWLPAVTAATADVRHSGAVDPQEGGCLLNLIA